MMECKKGCRNLCMCRYNIKYLIKRECELKMDDKLLSEWVENQAENTIKWHEKYDKKVLEVIKYIDELLMDLSENNLMELLLLFESDDLIGELRKNLKIGYMICIMSIFAQEINANEKNSVLELGKSVDDFVELIIRFKFLLWRIEFEDDKSSLEMVCNFVNEYSVSPQFIASMISYVSINKEKLYLELGDAFAERELVHHSTLLREHLNNMRMEIIR